MTKKYGGNYRISSARAPWWDYAGNGVYFITICTHNRFHFFGNIDVETPNLGVSTEMELNEIGALAQKFWMEIPHHFPLVVLDEFVVMPNHIHGIICIESSVQTPKTETNANKNWSSGSLGVIINQFKRQTTLHARKINPQFTWQSRFYDVIIRNEQSLQGIRRYVQNNPAQWHRDRNNDIGAWI